MIHNSNLQSLHEAGKVIHLANLPKAQRQYSDPRKYESVRDDDPLWTSPAARSAASTVCGFVSRAEAYYGKGTVLTGNALDPETEAPTGLRDSLGVYVTAQAFWDYASRLEADEIESRE